MSATQRSLSPATWLLPALAVVVGVMVTTWVWWVIFLALRGGDWRWCAWFAPVIALDLAWMLRVAAAPPGKARATLALLGTSVGIVLGLWLLTATEMARMMGIRPLESAMRMGPVLAGELLRHGLTAWDVGFLVLALPLAWRLGR
jgi:hypothetical protein